MTTICLYIASILLLFGTVSAAAPEASFTGAPASGTVPFTIAFTDTSAGEPTGWAWFFGDERYDEAWTGQTANAGWAARSGHSSVALPDGSIVLMGGYDGAALRNDTWRSTDSGVTWTLVNASSGWTARLRHSCVAMQDGSILLMGGRDDTDLRNDVWRSDDGGATWAPVNTSAGWPIREAHTAVTTPDGSVVLMGGWCYGCMNDVWRSQDSGATWIQVNASAGWSKRVSFASVAMSDGSIILMGGYDSANFRNMNDVWRSTDYGTTWTRVNESSGWSRRDVHTAVAMPDDSIVLMGGWDDTEFRNDVWRSCDYGTTWTEVNPGTRWPGRAEHSCVAMLDGSIILMGGGSSSSGPLNDVWRLQPAGSSEQDPQHEYTASGTYSVTLQAFNADGYTCARETGYVTVQAVPPTAAFSGAPVSGTAPLTVTFTDASIGGPSSWLWSFGDGETSTEQYPTHTYAAAGTYTINLTVGNAAGTDMLSETEYVEVSPAPVAPIAAFFGTPTSGRAPLTVSFTDTSTDDPTGWAWFFGDETYSEPWIEINASSGWTARNGHRAVTMPDGSIILMGGYDGTALRNDTWRSTDRGRTWTLMNASSGWTGRVQPGIVVLPDSSILLIGGDDPAYRNDVWRSADYGATWTLTSASSPWWGRWGHTTVAMPDGSIVLMGGFPGMIMNDTWRSADYGATWTLVNASSGWTARWAHTAVAMPDGSILLMGGYDRSRRNDVWRSDDYGATWTLVNASSGWMGRYGHTTVTMPDDSILVMGGIGMNDTWRSTDYGVTWTEVNVSSGWTERYYYSSVAMPDGSVLLMGGVSDDGTRLNDTWQLQPAGSSEQNPSHTYTTPGIYPVTLQAFNTGGHNSTRTTGYITVTPIAAFGSTPTSGPAPLTIAFTDISTGSPVAWNWLFGDGKTSTEQHPVHTYTLPGNYTVTLGVDGGLSTVTEPGYIKVTPVLFGDANEDGEVNQADTLVVLQEIVELREIPVAGTDRFRKTDVTGNGAIDVGDALFIAQYNVGLRDPWFVLL